MRLLYVIDSLAPGGAETSLADMAPGVVARGIDLHVLPLGHRLDLADRLRSAGAVIHFAGQRRGRLDSIRAVRRIARDVRPDLIHTTLYEADVAGRLAAWSLRIPASTSIVNDSYGVSHYAESKRLSLHAARALDMATAIPAIRFHALTNAIADSVAPRLAIPRDKLDVIPRGRDPGAFPFRPPGVRKAARSALGISGEASVIFSIGRLEPQKGHDTLLRALPLIASDHPNTVVLISGKDGRASTSLRALAGQLPLDIRFLGHRHDVAALLALADVFCFPSEREGFGGVLVEAMAVGCPVVASLIPTSAEVLGEGDASVGLLVESANPTDLARGIGAVLNNPQGADRRAHRGRIRFDDNFTIARTTEQMVAFFERVASSRD